MTAEALKKQPRRLIRADEVEPEKIEWLWLDRIPKGAFTLVAGRPGQGKSLFSAFLAGEVTRAGGGVILSNPEDHKAMTQVPRLLAAGADMRLVHFWPGILTVPQMVEELEFHVRTHGIELIVLDPIRKHLHGHDHGVALMPLVEMAERVGVAVVGIHHARKSVPSGAHPQEWVGGEAGGVLGTARAAYGLGPVNSMEDDARVLAPIKANIVSDEFSVELAIETVDVATWDGEEVPVPRLMLVSNECKVNAGAVISYAGGRKGAAGEKLDVATRQIGAEFLTMKLCRGPLAVQALQDEALILGISWSTLRRASDDLAIVKRRVGFGPGSHRTWELPPDHPAIARVTPGRKAKRMKGGAIASVDDLIASALGGNGGSDS